MKNFNLLFLFSCLFIGSVYSQQDFLMYNMRDIPQSNYSNPSNQFNGKFYIGLPVISSNYYSISNSGFAYSDVVKKQGDSLLLDLNSLIGELEDENFTSFNAKVDLFSFGVNLGKKTQLTFNVTENVNFKFNYTKDFVRLIYEGNGAFIGQTASFKNLGIALYHYREYGLGFSHQFSDKLRFGARAKYLYGMANIYSEKTDISLTTDAETFALTALADVNIQTSGLRNFDQLEFGDYTSGRDNTGYGLDLGVNYDLNEKLSFNASVLDIGYIKWNDDIENYVIEEGEYTYSGIGIDAFTIDEDSTGETSFDRVLDSLEKAFDVKENGDAYSTPLVTRMYLGANYKLNDKTILGGLIQTEFFQESVRPSFTASLNRKLSKWFTVAGSYTVINRSYNNLGLGVNFNPGPVQLYVMSDNILSAFKPQHARYAQVRFGINLIFGSKKTPELNAAFIEPIKKEKKERDEEEGEEEIE